MIAERLSAVWPEWKVVEQLGEGSYGKVYKAVREGHGVTSSSAIKIISIPQSDAELASMRSEGLDETGTRSYFEGIVTDFVNEIKLMESMKGTSNIVSVEDYKVLEKTDKVGWDIFIRMELLTPLNDYTADNKLTEAEVIKLGQDVCSALELCAQRNIIHRDIKPENILVSSFGDFKVGDFGIARELEKTSGSLSQKGTYNYMAPEVITSKYYDASVDIYSLGLILYKLLNNNRLPFLDPNAQLIQYQDRKNAVDRRFRGEALPAPINASPHLADIILMACAFKPEGRFKTPTAFKNALGSAIGASPRPAPTVATPPPVIPAQPDHLPVSHTRPIPAPIDIDATMAVHHTPEAVQPVAAQPEPANEPTASFGKKKKSKKPLVIAICTLLTVAIGVGAFFVLGQGGLQSILPGNHVNRVIAALENHNYAQASAIFNDNRGDIDMGAFESALSGRLDGLRSEFLEEAVSYNVAIMELNTIRDWQVTGLNSQLTEVGNFIGNLNDSRVAFQMAETQFASGDFLGAINNYQLVSMEDPNFNLAREGLDRAIGEYRTAVLAEAAAYAAGRNFDQAIFVLDGALEVTGNDAQLAGQRETYAREHVGTGISDAQALAAGGNYTGAMSALRALDAQVPGNAEVARAIASIETAHVNSMVSQARDLADRDQFEQALRILNDGLRTYPGNTALTNMANQLESHEIALLLAQADAYADARRFDDAIRLLQTSRLTHNSEVLAMIAQLTGMLPVPFLETVPWFERSSSSMNIATVNMQGNAFPNTMNNSNNWSSVWSHHNLNREFGTLTGTIGRIDGSGAGARAIVFIGDGRTLATFNVEGDTPPTDISVNVAGISILRIEIGFQGSGGARPALTNIMLEQ